MAEQVVTDVVEPDASSDARTDAVGEDTAVSPETAADTSVKDTVTSADEGSTESNGSGCSAGSGSSGMAVPLIMLAFFGLVGLRRRKMTDVA